MRGKGFTLIETTMVVLIMGIVASLALPTYQPLIERARGVEAMSNLSMIHTAQKVYQLDNGEYADDIDALGIEDPNDNSRALFDYKISKATKNTYTAKAE